MNCIKRFPEANLVGKMRHYRIELLFNRVINEKDKSSECDSYDPYVEEHNRLGTLKDDSEDLWEERTYQLSAGGLSLTFAVFSFLMSGDNGMPFHWEMAVIWGGYVFCLVANYISQRISICNFKSLQKQLDEDRQKGVAYDENILADRNLKSDWHINILNTLTEIILVIDIIFTIVYTCVLFCEK